MSDFSKTSLATYKVDIESSPSLNYVDYRLEMLTKIRFGPSRPAIFSFLKRISVVNESDNDLFDAKIVFDFSGDFARCEDIPLACLQKKKTTIVRNFEFHADSKFLYELSESVPSSFTISLVDGKNNVLCAKTIDFIAFPIEQSASSDFVKESLASFITPNDDLVKELSNKAAKLMESKHSTSSFVGYQTHDPEVVMRELDSLYLALQAEGIHYSNPPASFEMTFQRVRMPRNVISCKTATCLDFALLYASMCEAVGLNPLIVVMDGHAFNAVWLDDYHYPNAVSDNLTVLTNDCSSTDRRMVLVDPTCAASGFGVNFASCLNKASSEIGSMRFSWVLDVCSARLDYILPLLTPHVVNGKTEINYDDAISVDYELPSIEQSAGSLGLEAKGSKSKFDVWEENLLDLEMSNNLINHKIGSSSVQLGASSVFDFFSKASRNDKPVSYTHLTLPTSFTV